MRAETLANRSSGEGVPVPDVRCTPWQIRRSRIGGRVEFQRTRGMRGTTLNALTRRAGAQRRAEPSVYLYERGFWTETNGAAYPGWLLTACTSRWRCRRIAQKVPSSGAPWAAAATVVRHSRTRRSIVISRIQPTISLPLRVQPSP